MTSAASAIECSLHDQTRATKLILANSPTNVLTGTHAQLGTARGSNSMRCHSSTESSAVRFSRPPHDTDPDAPRETRERGVGETNLVRCSLSRGGVRSCRAGRKRHRTYRFAGFARGGSACLGNDHAVALRARRDVVSLLHSSFVLLTSALVALRAAVVSIEGCAGKRCKQR